MPKDYRDPLVTPPPVPAEKPEDFLYAWYSAGQKRVDRRILREPNQGEPLRCFGRLEDGTEIEYTTCSERPEHGTEWQDIRFVGLIRKGTIRTEKYS